MTERHWSDLGEHPQRKRLREILSKAKGDPLASIRELVDRTPKGKFRAETRRLRGKKKAAG